LTPAQADAPARPPFWRDVRVIGWAFQVLIVGIVAAIVAFVVDNYRVNSVRLNVPTSFDFLDQPAGFPIPSSDFRTTQPVRDALFEGFQNTLRLALTGIVLATMLGLVLGVARLSRNFLVRSAARVYVEFVRNVPLLAILTLMYVAVVLNAFPRAQDSLQLGPVAIVNVRGASVFWLGGGNWALVMSLAATAIGTWLVVRWRRRADDRAGRPSRAVLWAAVTAIVLGAVCWFAFGLSGTAPQRDGNAVTGGITMSPEYFAALAALVLTTSSQIAEIVRGSMQAVPRGQTEAAEALALSGLQRTWFVLLPQALRIAVPPIGNQYLNLAKNSSLAAVISFAEITKITQLTVANRSPAVPAFVLLLGIYLVLSLVLSLIVNIVNWRLRVVER
jgi:general L-amino acid transport system permease protein